VSDPKSAAPAARRGGFRTYVLGVVVVSAVLAALAFAIARTSPVRGAIQSYMRLVAASNRGDVETVRALCTERYLARTRLDPAGERVLEGIPQGISQNFQGWEEDGAVLFCPSDRVGPVYRLVRAGDAWKFDGPVGLLRGDGRVERVPEAAPVDSRGGAKPQ
jgi:hypothetical protein